jgi:hypothetical protein
MAVPVALTNMDDDSARFAAAEFESEREQLEEWYAAGVGDLRLDRDAVPRRPYTSGFRRSGAVLSGPQRAGRSPC